MKVNLDNLQTHNTWKRGESGNTVNPPHENPYSTIRSEWQIGKVSNSFLENRDRDLLYIRLNVADYS